MTGREQLIGSSAKRRTPQIALFIICLVLFSFAVNTLRSFHAPIKKIHVRIFCFVFKKFLKTKISAQNQSLKNHQLTFRQQRLIQNPLQSRKSTPIDYILNLSPLKSKTLFGKSSQTLQKARIAPLTSSSSIQNTAKRSLRFQAFPGQAILGQGICFTWPVGTGLATGEGL